MTKRWSGITKPATVDVGAVVILAVMLRLACCSQRPSAEAVDGRHRQWQQPFRCNGERHKYTANLARAKTETRWLSLLASVVLMLVACSEVRGQFRSRLGNPSITVETEHPPTLRLITEKIVFGPATGDCGNEVVSAMREHFAAKSIEVVDWQSLDEIPADRDFSFRGHLDQRSADLLGKILGPSTLLMVNVTRCEADRQRFKSSVTRKDSENDETYKVTIYHAKTAGLLDLSVQTVDLASGRIFDAQSIMHSPSLENESEDGYPESPSKFAVQAIAFQRAAHDLSRMLLPRIQKRSLIFFDNKKCNLKAAYQALKRGEEERALNLSLEILDACKNYPDPKMKEKMLRKILANAHYNVGILHRIRGDLDVALEYLLEAERLRPVEIMAEAVADCRGAIDARDAMQSIREESQQAALQFQERLEALTMEEQIRRDNTLTNSGVVALVKMGLPEAIIVKKIETSTCEFDVTPEALLSLTKAGVGEIVILSMMEIQKSDNGR